LKGYELNHNYYSQKTRRKLLLNHRDFFDLTEFKKNLNPYHQQWKNSVRLVSETSFFNFVGDDWPQNQIRINLQMLENWKMTLPLCFFSKIFLALKLWNM